MENQWLIFWGKILAEIMISLNKRHSIRTQQTNNFISDKLLDIVDFGVHITCVYYHALEIWTSLKFPNSIFWIIILSS